jgi:hypothetical protein
MVGRKMSNEIHYFITVEWCNNGVRGIFCSKTGTGYWKSCEHTEEEMNEVLMPFGIILSPKSEPFTQAQLAKMTKWIPLAEYSHQYGIAWEVK